MTANLKIRKAELTDLPALTHIYNQAILAHQTADTIPYTPEGRRPWFDTHLEADYPLYTVLIGDDIAGYGTLSKYRGGRPALKRVVEVSYYLHPKAQGKGVGTRLLRYLLVKAQQLGFAHAYALLLDKNIASIVLLKKCGFEQWGHLPNIANLDGEICGQYIFGKLIDPSFQK